MFDIALNNFKLLYIYRYNVYECTFPDTEWSKTWKNKKILWVYIWPGISKISCAFYPIFLKYKMKIGSRHIYLEYTFVIFYKAKYIRLQNNW